MLQSQLDVASLRVTRDWGYNVVQHGNVVAVGIAGVKKIMPRAACLALALSMRARNPWNRMDARYYDPMICQTLNYYSSAIGEALDVRSGGAPAVGGFQGGFQGGNAPGRLPGGSAPAGVSSPPGRFWASGELLQPVTVGSASAPLDELQCPWTFDEPRKKVKTFGAPEGHLPWAPPGAGVEHWGPRIPSPGGPPPGRLLPPPPPPGFLPPPSPPAATKVGGSAAASSCADDDPDVVAVGFAAAQHDRDDVAGADDGPDVAAGFAAAQHVRDDVADGNAAAQHDRDDVAGGSAVAAGPAANDAASLGAAVQHDRNDAGGSAAASSGVARTSRGAVMGSADSDITELLDSIFDEAWAPFELAMSAFSSRLAASSSGDHASSSGDCAAGKSTQFLNSCSSSSNSISRSSSRQ